jgi:hypothetical protein
MFSGTTLWDELSPKHDLDEFLEGFAFFLKQTPGLLHAIVMLPASSDALKDISQTWVNVVVVVPALSTFSAAVRDLVSSRDYDDLRRIGAGIKVEIGFNALVDDSRTASRTLALLTTEICPRSSIRSVFCV